MDNDNSGTQIVSSPGDEGYLKLMAKLDANYKRALRQGKGAAKSGQSTNPAKQAAVGATTNSPDTTDQKDMADQAGDTAGTEEPLEDSATDNSAGAEGERETPRTLAQDAKHAKVREQDEETIYAHLERHQTTQIWTHRDTLQDLHIWANRFRFEFKLETPELTIGVHRLRGKALATFQPGHNAFGLRGEILIDVRHLEASNTKEGYYDLLGTLLHELLHCDQYFDPDKKAGKRNYHNRQFRRRAAELGLIVQANGEQTYEPEPETPFFALLRRYGVVVPDNLPETRYYESVAARPSLGLWTCGCQPPVRARIGIAKFDALCLRCNCRFELYVE